MTQAQTITVTDLRNATRAILENAHFRGRHYIVERSGQPCVAILDAGEYERLRQVAAECEAAPEPEPDTLRGEPCTRS